MRNDSADANTPLPTVWEIPDELWERIEPILSRHYQPAATGRPRADLRLVLDTIIYRLRSGCRWNRLPAELADDATAHTNSPLTRGILRSEIVS